MFNKKVWKDGEKTIKEHMEDLGYKIKYTNFNAGGVELDIVAVLTKKMQIKQLTKSTRSLLKVAETKDVKKSMKERNKSLKDMFDDTLIICEVKARTSEEFGKGYISVDSAKQARLIKGAKYLLTKKEFEGYTVRFDVGSVDNGVVTYFENAFEA